VIRVYKGIRPQVGARAFVGTSAQVIGDVEIGEDASVWMNATYRAEGGKSEEGQ